MVVDENPESTEPETEEPVALLHPFYLDTEMSMAFAAALAGGVALEREEFESDRNQSEAVRNLRGNLRVFNAGIGGKREGKELEAVATESRLVRRHTEASIFIALYDALRRSGRIVDDIDPAALRPGQIVAIEVGPAVAPLRRVVDQIIRLLDLAAPFSGSDQDQQTPSLNRQQRRQREREALKRGSTDAGDEEDGPDIDQIKSLFVALKDDLDQSGMIDVVVAREDAPSVVLTLDKRLVSDQALELLHTSRFTVIGKVTEIWPTEDDIANLYRRSVMSLLPALAGTVTWGMLLMLVGFASVLDYKQLERQARDAAGVRGDEGSDEDEDEDEDEIRLGDAVDALNPMIAGPAIQVLPLAICA